MSQEAVELAPLWIQHDSDMSFPNHQITGLRFLNSSEILGSAIQVRRTRIRIGEPRPVIYRVHQMRAVANATDPNGIRIEMFEFGPQSPQGKAIASWK